MSPDGARRPGRRFTRPLLRLLEPGAAAAEPPLTEEPPPAEPRRPPPEPPRAERPRPIAAPPRAEPPPSEPAPVPPRAERPRPAPRPRAERPRARPPFAPEPVPAAAGARSAVRAERRRAARRDPVSRSAEFTGAVLALSLVALGLLLGLILQGAEQAVLGAAGGLVVAGIAMDIYARALGAWSARENTPLAVVLAVIGSPAVLWHALARRRGRLAPEPGAIAGLLVPILLLVFFWAQASA